MGLLQRCQFLKNKYQALCATSLHVHRFIRWTIQHKTKTEIMAKSNLFVVTFNNKLLKRYTVILCDDPMMRRENLFCELQVIR